MWFVELVAGMLDWWCSWRVYLCLVLSLGTAAALHDRFNDQAWVPFVSVPIAVIGAGFGFWWQSRADRMNDRY